MIIFLLIVIFVGWVIISAQIATVVGSVAYGTALTANQVPKVKAFFKDKELPALQVVEVCLLYLRVYQML